MSIDLKTAPFQQLERIPGLGRRRAEEIVDFRNKNPLETWDDVRRIPGFSADLVKALQDGGMTVAGIPGDEDEERAD